MTISAQIKTTSRLFAAFLFLGLVATSAPARAQTKDSMLQFQLSDELKKNATAWNRGDLDGFLANYVTTDDFTYVSGGQIVKGFDALKERYAKRYGDSPESMGKLSFSDIDVWRLAEDRALLVGRWKLDREDAAEKRTDDGVFTLVMVKDGTDWKIFHDHTSLSSDR